MNPLEQLTSEWEEDAVFDWASPGLELARNQRLHTKYIRLLGQARKTFSMLDLAYKKLYAEKFNYYVNGPVSNADAVKRASEWSQMPVRGQKYIKQDLPMNLDADEDVQVLKLRRDEAENIKLLLEDIMKQIGNRGFSVNSSIEWQKFLAGTRG